jgi:ribosomal protein S25
MPTDESFLRLQFLDYVFGKNKGYVCVATGTPVKGAKDKFNQKFFEWPKQRDDIGAFVVASKDKNIWFGVNLLGKAQRLKDNCLQTDIIWADLDTCHPSLLDPKPQVVVETSPDKYQALWKLDYEVPAALAEEYAKRIFEKYKINGVDSGWALTKLLRIPFTKNFKYSSVPPVKLISANEDTTDPEDFEKILIERFAEQGVDDVDMPNIDELPAPELIIHEHRHDLMKTGFNEIYFVEPGEDWSEVIWRLIAICLEAGMTREETLVVANSAKCNKYNRDGRPLLHLWHDVVKKDTIDKTFAIIAGDLDNDLKFPTIISDEESDKLEDGFIDKYIKWGSSVTDANRVYHELCGAMMLSCVLADKIHLELSFARVYPNLWGLVLGESTLTRKTTAMELAMGFVNEIDENSVISTHDASAEGMIKALADRPEKISIYYRDEVAGFFHAMSTKSYLAGMPETLTKLYDVPPIMVRPLSKETITVKKPVFIFFGGGIQDRVYETVNEDFFFSGFLPRFLVVNGESNIENLQWMGPPVSKNGKSDREVLRSELHSIVDTYQVQVVDAKIFGEDAKLSKEVEVELTDEAWLRMQETEKILTLTANESTKSNVALPTFTRMATSLLKLSILIAATRQEPRDFLITCELRDVLKASQLIQNWAPHSVHMMNNVGTTTSERLIGKVLRMIRATPGITRAEIMRRNHIQSVPARIVFDTLIERGLITQKSAGRGYKLWPV